jgi:FMN reductase
MKILILSCSLSSASKSRLLAEAARAAGQAKGLTVEWADLRDFPLPLCDGEKAYGDPHVARLRGMIEGATGLVVAAPIYNYDVNAAAKNAIELTGSAWENKAVAFLCAAGGQSSYMSVMSLANSLMLDFRCVIVPRFVYSTPAAFSGGAIVDPKVRERILHLVDDLCAVAATSRSTAE